MRINVWHNIEQLAVDSFIACVITALSMLICRVKYELTFLMDMCCN